jgi:hypothetical protein
LNNKKGTRGKERRRMNIILPTWKIVSDLRKASGQLASILKMD